MCCAEVGVACEKVKMVLLELYGWATFGSAGLSGYTSERSESQYLFNELSAT
jgi:hypothetical protein